MELESAKRHLRNAEDSVSLMPENVQSPVPHLREVAAVHEAFEAAWAAEEPKFLSQSRSESGLPGDITNVPQCVGQLGDNLARLCQKCDGKVEHLLVERDGLQVRLGSTASEL